MSKKYVWQRAKWPNFTWQSDTLLEPLGQARKAQGQIIAQADFIGLELQADVVVEDAVTTAAIEGDILNRDSVRSSVAKKLGLPTAGLPSTKRHVDGLVAMLIDATQELALPFTKKRLFGWHAGLFPTGYSSLQKITVANWRKSKEPMQVVSGTLGREKVHFEAVPSQLVASEMKEFFKWWNQPPEGMDGLIRAGLAHFWFITIHPFDDGNGRIARALTDMAIAQDEKIGRRLYSLSAQIHKERDAYYDVLEKSQKSTTDVTHWLHWFLEVFVRSIYSSQDIIHKAFAIAKFWQTHSQGELNSRQVKAINRLLEAGKDKFAGGLTNRKYVNLNKVSREIAKRDLADLEKRGILKRNSGKGRSVSYSLVFVD